MLEARETPATISGTVFQMLNVAGLYPQPNPSFLTGVSGVQVFLDGGSMQTTPANGTYSFSGVAAGPHTISIVPPSSPTQFVGFSAQSLSYNLVLGTNDFTNLNFALTARNSALVQNLYELVLSRPADLDGFNQQSAELNASASNAGKAFQSLWASTESKALSRPIGKLIEAFFPGPLDVGMFRNAVQLQNLGVSQDATVLQIIYSQTFVDQFGDTSDLDNTAFVNFAFQNLLLRNPTNSERSAQVDKLQSGLLNRGQLLLQLVNSAEFGDTRPNVSKKVAISLAYLGVLGREATPNQLQNRLNQLNDGKSLKFVANQLAKSTEFQNLTGFTDTFIWDVQAHQIEPAVNLLSRLQLYDPATQQFDIPVTADSITSSVSSPSNVYFIAHGWAPSLTEDVLLQSTPGNPLKWWQSEDSPWLLAGVDQVSSEGIAQAIVDKDPLAKVVAFSWLDQSNTPETNQTTSFAVAGAITEGSPIVTGVDTSKLVAGMDVTGPGMAIGAKVKSIDNSGQLTLTQLATATLTDVTLTYATTNLLVETQNGTTTNGSPVVTGLDTSTLWAGMTVAGPDIPTGTIIVNIDSSSQVTLSANATGGSTAALTFKGLNLGQEVKEFMLAGQSASYTQLNGLRLASAIQQALNINFFSGDGLIHLLGHSHGAKVATVAALALQNAGVPVSQLSIFESPEAGPAFGSLNAHLPSFGNAQNYLWYYLRQMNLSRTPVQVGTRTPTPPTGGKYPTFVDNYFSHEGFGSALGGVNVSGFGGGDLTPIVDTQFYAEQLYGGFNTSNPLGDLDVLFGSHDYPPPWYAQASLQPPAVQQNGLSWSPLLDASNSTGLSDFYQQAFVRTGDVTNGSAVVMNINTTSLLPGMIVTETPSSLPNNNIAAGTTILTIDGPNQLTLSQPVAGSGPVTGESLTFIYSPDQFVIRQYELETATRPTASPIGPIPLAYAQQYTTGSVTDDGSQITLSVDAANSVAIDAITYAPLAALGPFFIGGGMDLQVEFSGVPAGEQVELVVWIRGLVSTPRVENPSTSQLATLGSTVGYMSTPLLTLNGGDVGTAVQSATISLGSYLNADPDLLGPFNAVNNGSATTLLPTLGFTLIGDVSSQVTVTISNMRQFSV